MVLLYEMIVTICRCDFAVKRKLSREQYVNNVLVTIKQGRTYK